MTTESNYYQHKYGGIYMYIDTVTNKSNNDQSMVLYKHIYPFEKKTYVKNKHEFDESNKKISTEELDQLLSKPKELFQKEIIEKKEQNKKLKKDKEVKVKILDISDLGYIV